MGLMDTSLPFDVERQARQGIRFSTFYAQSVSSPSHISLLMGQNAARHRTTNWMKPPCVIRLCFGGWCKRSGKPCVFPLVLYAE